VRATPIVLLWRGPLVDRPWFEHRSGSISSQDRLAIRSIKETAASAQAATRGCLGLHALPALFVWDRRPAGGPLGGIELRRIELSKSTHRPIDAISACENHGNEGDGPWNSVRGRTPQVNEGYQHRTLQAKPDSSYDFSLKARAKTALGGNLRWQCLALGFHQR
jgi:hypothetical protein